MGHVLEGFLIIPSELSSADLNQRLRMLGTAVAIEKVIDVGTGSLQRPVALRDICLEFVHAIRRLGTLIHLHPDTGLLRNHFALAVERSAARTVPKILRTRHRADIF